MVKFLLFCGILLLTTLGGFAQTTNQSFLKISHLGKQGRPFIDLYISAQTPELNPAQGMDSRYRFESVCLLTEAELAPLLRYAESYLAKTKSDGKDTSYGTFEITLGSGPTKQVVYSHTKALAFLNGAAQVLQQQAADPDTNEALRRLTATVHRLGAPR